ncbi:hypothetical protein AHAT_18960 [Agarivorans sp. Toyoura001]|uniref:hypothetical protein n=1 Tax=Agarivorans sp. Toyoura001 TaxID=2283141 RepID=UPI0010E74C5E|nr:hypothetical protein [Agarivorans sp. Toyoura001]GDY26006.1 hypothetical protein AHAT_18960 [Agarivorans sp. Toyoura001]
MNKRLQQWSTLRGFAVMAAAVFGLNPELIQAGTQAMDTLPAVVVAGVGLYDVVRKG